MRTVQFTVIGTITCDAEPAMPMLHSRLLILMLAALLIVQSALGSALHRCDDDGMAMHDVATAAMANAMDSVMPHCHGNATDHDNAKAPTAHPGTDHTTISHTTTPHGICTCAIAHCAPALVSHFEFVSAPTHAPTAPLYRFIVLSAPTETLLRPPIFS